MKSHKLSFLAAISSIALLTGSAFAQGSMNNFSQALDHSGKAVGNSVVGTVKLSAAVVGAPLYVSGKIGEAMGEAGTGLMDFANSNDDEPLPLTEENVSVGPDPKSALNQGAI